MGKKIVVLTGSPRKNGNTDRMVAAFEDKAKACGHEVVKFNAATSNVGGCHACEKCFSAGKACIYDDDFNTWASDLLAADAIVIATPTYWYSFPGQVKNAIDKFYSFCIGEKQEFFGKECALIACCEEHDASVMDGLSQPFDKIAALLKWNVVGKVLVPAVLKVGDVDKTDGCAQAAAFAGKF